MAWYKTGTATVTNGSTTVTGSGTSWIVGVGIGEAFYAPDGRIYEIANIVSATQLTLGSNYLGTTASGQAYQIVPTQSYIRDLAAQAAQLVADYAGIASNAGAGKFGDGTIASPGVQFVSDSNLGIRRAGADDMRLVANGADQVQITGTATTFLTPSAISVNSSTNALRITQVGTGNALLVEGSANPDSSPFVIDQNGRTVLGATAPYASFADGGGTNRNPFFQMFGATIDAASAALVNTQLSATSSIFTLAKSRSTSPTTRTAVVSADPLGALNFSGDDGTRFVVGASISAAVDGTPGTNDMPGRLMFSTTADGASSPTERMRITNGGSVLIGASIANNSRFMVQGGITTLTRETANIAAPTNVDLALYSRAQLANTATPQLAFCDDRNDRYASIGSYRGAFSTQVGLSFFTDDSLGVQVERMRIDHLGNFGVGAATAAGVSFLLGKAITGAITSSGIVQQGQIQSDVTTSYNAILSIPTTQAATFTLSNIRHFFAAQGTFGVGSVVSNQYGFVADSSLIGATNNFGFYSNLAVGTGRWNFYAVGTASNYFGGNVGIGSTSLFNTNFRVSNAITGAATSYGSFYNGTVQPTVTASAVYQQTQSGTAANGSVPYTISAIRHYSALQGTFHADSTVTNQYGFFAESGLVGATNNFGFYSNIASGTGRWNFYAKGTAANYFAGETTVNSGLTIGRTAVTAPAASDGNVYSGYYTPTLTNGTNVTASTATVCQYMRVGNVVTVSGIITGIAVTAATASLLDISLPISSTLAAARLCAGNGTFYSSTLRSVAGAIYANTATNIARLDFLPTAGATAQTLSFQFTYWIT